MILPENQNEIIGSMEISIVFWTRPMGNRSVAVRSDYVDTIATFLFYIDWRISRWEVVMGYWPVCVRSGLRLDKMKSSIIKKSSARIINSLPWPSTPTINRKNNFSKMVSHTQNHNSLKLVSISSLKRGEKKIRRELCHGKTTIYDKLVIVHNKIWRI